MIYKSDSLDALSVANQILEELQRATLKHSKPFNSSHEGYAVLLEEVDELWEEVRKQTEERSYAKMRKEAVQIGAMAMRFILDVCESRMPGRDKP